MGNLTTWDFSHTTELISHKMDNKSRRQSQKWTTLLKKKKRIKNGESSFLLGFFLMITYSEYVYILYSKRICFYALKLSAEVILHFQIIF